MKKQKEHSQQLSKAELQSALQEKTTTLGQMKRELEVEASLERVRAKAMAMHRSEDLALPVASIFEELEKLNLGTLRCGIGILDKEKRTVDVWTTLKTDNGVIAQVSGDESMDSHPLLQGAIDSWLKQEDYDYSLEGEDLYSYYQTQGGANFKLPVSQSILSKTEGLKEYYHLASFRAGGLYAFRNTAFPDEAKIVMKRFAAVFDQTYTRFLDLQKAEAQAREAQLELAMERVRARTMAMQNSNELPEAANLLFQQVQSLGMPAWSAGYCIWYEDKKAITLWMSSEGVLQPPFKAPTTDDPSFIHMRDAHERGETFFVEEIGGEELIMHYKYMRTLPVVGEILDSIIEAGHPLPTFQIFHCVYFSQGFLLFITYEPVPEAHNIFKRFTNVFEQTYTRFLDLQTAEAQARESQIQLAMERVRARTMAMQRSDELPDAAILLSNQVKELGVQLFATSFQLWDEDRKEVTVWACIEDFIIPPSKVSTTEDPLMIHILEAAEKGETLFIEELGGEALENHNKYMMSIPTFREGIESVVGQGVVRPVLFVFHAAYFANGYILFNSPKPCPEAHDIFKRFAKVFEQTYTRFLDLQKAEAQARESQIQLALERVRARTMAMQKSEELPETSYILFEQMKELGEPVEQLTIGVVQEENKVIEISATLHGDILKKIYQHSLDEPFMMSKIYHAWKTHQKTLIVELKGDELNAYNKYRNELTKSEMFPTNLGDEHRRIVYAAFFSKGMLALGANEPRPPESLQLLERFAGVFDQAYIRFIDLKNAEAQARESQIQLAMERVRARTMAMQNSNELAEAASLLFKQIADLGTKQWSSGFDIWNANEVSAVAWMSNPDGSMGIPFTVPYTEDPFFKQIYEARQSGEDFFVMESSGRELEETYQYLFNLAEAKKHFDGVESLGFQMPKFQITHCAFFSQGYLMFITFEAAPEMWDIFKRFAKVFEQTYTRFLDLQKAEAQTREAKIEAALEKVRSRTMAMQNSSELGDVATVLFKELNQLVDNLWTCGFVLCEKDRAEDEWWLCTEGGFIPAFYLPNVIDATHANIYQGWLNGEEYHTEQLEGEALKEHYDWLMNIPISRKIFEDMSAAGFSLPTWQKLHCAYFSKGYLCIITQVPCPEELVFRRFAQVFDLTYTRFLDLQKAEAQAREAKIEAALEKVRSRTMAMQRSEELSNVATVLFQQVKALGVPQWACGFCIWDIGDTECMWHPGGPDGEILTPLRFPLTEHTVFRVMDESRKRGDELYIYEKEGELQADHYRYMMTLPGVRESLQDMLDAGLTIPTFQIDHYANFAYGNLIFITYEHFPEMHDIFKRFAKVFEQTYTRFLDLQKAEAQSRESQIQLAMERVRARTMAMQRSDELANVATVLFQQVKALGVPQWTCGFSIFEIDDKEFTWYPGSAEGDILPPVKIPLTEHPVFISINESRKRGDELFVYEKGGEFQADHYRYMRSLPDGEEMYQNTLKAGLTMPTFQIDHVANFSHGNLLFITYEHFPEMHDVFKRFAKVFEQTYTRFLDLQKAEAQARESKIEAALERVRSRTMAMQHSEELKEAANLLFNQVKELGIHAWSCGYNIWDDDRKAATVWMSSEGTIQPPFKTPLTEYPTFIHFYEAAQRGESLFIEEMGGEVLKAHYRYMLTLPDLGGILDNIRKAGFSTPTFQVNHAVFFSYGYLLFITYEPYPEAHDIFKRFAKVFEQTYTRFLDLQKAEAQTKEVVKQASVDRVRAEIASMRTTSDLEKITPLIWNELTTLGVPFIRCGVFIMDQQQQQVHTFLSTPDGKAIAAFHQPYNTPGETALIIASWQKKEMYKQHWDEARFIEFTKNLVQQGAITSGEKYLTENRPTDLYLHFLPFLQGMLYAGNTTALSDDELQLVQNLADAFSTAYARYEDFNKLESANSKIEKTLVDLKQAQAQLVQSEKMASLGELTAGIAHEIQNPLNFVNNFSEVNTELIEEMQQEMEKGNLDEAKAISKDIKENEQKINHHGKRAGDIVKGMLQHSRSSSATKEPTDINKLADEYLRLAYHGLRAKDKLFNATMKTDFDETIGNINIIPQDIGRVLLNLYNNAFYAAFLPSPEKIGTGTGGSSDSDQSYNPTVYVSTKKLDDKVLISVKDNGPGIPQKILDKIFQPFFTTKPTGQGTGLGLSLAYDIVKAHGGELKVETKEGDGSEFIISLPII